MFVNCWLLILSSPTPSSPGSTMSRLFPSGSSEFTEPPSPTESATPSVADSTTSVVTVSMLRELTRNVMKTYGSSKEWTFHQMYFYLPLPNSHVRKLHFLYTWGPMLSYIIYRIFLLSFFLHVHCRYPHRRWLICYCLQLLYTATTTRKSFDDRTCFSPYTEEKKKE